MLNALIKTWVIRKNQTYGRQISESCLIWYYLVQTLRKIKMFMEHDELEAFDALLKTAEAAVAALSAFVAQQREAYHQNKRELDERARRWDNAYEECRIPIILSKIQQGFISQKDFDENPNATHYELMLMCKGIKPAEDIKPTIQPIEEQTPSAPVTPVIPAVQTPSAPVTPVIPAVQTPSALPTLLLVKRCGSLFLYQDMDGKIVAKRELLPQTFGNKPVPDSVSEFNPEHFIVEYGTEGATKILERYTLEQLNQSCPKETPNLSKEKLINLIVRLAVKRLSQQNT